MKYRLVKKTSVTGFSIWVVQRKSLWWWEYMDSYIDEEKARTCLIRLRNGHPLWKKEVMDE